MKINYIAVYTIDIERLSEFYENFFYSVKSDDYKDNATGFIVRNLKFDGGTGLKLMAYPNTGIKADNCKLPRTVICVKAGGRKNVDSVTARVFKAGYHVTRAPEVTGDGCYESCVEDPDENLVVVTE